MTDHQPPNHRRDQLTWHRPHQLRDRPDGLTHDEPFREPVPGRPNVRPHRRTRREAS